MTDIPLELIDDNPFRDFELHPIDETQVERLKASIYADGFWTSVAARPAGNRYQLAFGHHRVEAARRLGWDEIPIEVRDLSDWQMVRRLASENATQRGTTAAACLDAIAAISKVLAYSLIHCDQQTFSKIFENVDLDYKYLRGHVLGGHAIGETCILQAMPVGSFTTGQVRVALGVLKDSGRMATIVAEASGAAASSEPAIFDARCARLFKVDYHLSEFRRIVTDPTVRSYLPVNKQYEFGQQLIGELGDSEITGVKLREHANGLFYRMIGVARSNMRNSRLRITDDRVRDALNFMRRGTHDIKRSCAMVADLIAEGVEVSPEIVARFSEYMEELETALISISSKRSRRNSNLRLIVNKGGDVA
jgi:ParB-like nuclease family protein